MTWTLRLYDENGVEIGWVQKTNNNEYSYSVTHPSPEWEFMDSTLNKWRRVYSEIEEFPKIKSPIQIMVDPGRIEDELTPKEHLQEIKDSLSGNAGIGSLVLADE